MIISKGKAWIYTKRSVQVRKLCHDDDDGVL